MHSLSSLTAFALVVLLAFLRSGHIAKARKQPRRLVLLWILAAATIILWTGCVVILHSNGMPL